MNILHVIISNPQKHQGGMNRYCFDLMEAEQKLGHSCFAIFPGSLSFVLHKPKIINIKNGLFVFNRCLPVSITYGIDSPKRYMRKYKTCYFINWFKEYKINIIHVHSIQGFPIEFFLAAKTLGIKMVFTTHDYFPMCFKCSLFCYDESLCDSINLKKCVLCSKHASLSPLTQFIRQSSLFDSNFFVKIKKFLVSPSKKVKDRMHSVPKTSDSSHQISDKDIANFKLLNEYYKRIFDLFDVVCFNSPLTKKEYLSHGFIPNKSFIIPVTEKGLKENNFLCRKNIKELHFSYFGGNNCAKGFGVLLDAIRILYSKEPRGWSVALYGGTFGHTTTLPPNTTAYHYFEKDEEQSVWLNTDVVIVPSIWFETFGLVVVEALSRGKPVIVSSNVGSAYLVGKIDKKEIFDYGNANSLSISMYNLLNKSNFSNFKSNISLDWLIFDIDAHAKKIVEEVYK